MLQIGIYSENAGLREELERSMQLFCETLCVTGEPHSFSSAHRLEADIGQTAYDLFILDIDIEQGDFQEIARTIRYTHADCCMILVSHSAENAIFGYAVKAADYLIKPVAFENLQNAASRVLKHRLDHVYHEIKVRINGIWVRIALDRVLYVESSGHNIIFHMEDGNNVKIIATLRDYVPVLNVSKNFLRCHKSYVVNLDYVGKIGQSAFVLHNGEQINISRQYRQASKSYYVNYSIDKTVT